ncbi:hypothetical protein EVAR_96571_1 [Eumeta japonica]|uniref:Uncharacterized protein n=1 Tax=Eumeta variegata TaxID=151549 RepID=A0A4C1WSE8_EUMVA|nr:hypothetical protein EVAR_96571_1 [Eumeta japonica]
MQLPSGTGNTANTKSQDDRSQEAPQRAKGYPPIVVQCLPNWTRHFSLLRKILGHPPNARPFKSGVCFLPATAEEFRITQRYLQSMSRSSCLFFIQLVHLNEEEL